MKLRLLYQGGKVNAEQARVAALQNDGNVVGLIQMLDSDVRGVTQYSIVRGDAAFALGQLRDERAVPHLIEMRHDPEQMVRMQVMWALGRFKREPVEATLREGLADEATMVRESAATSLAQVGAADAIPLLRTMADSDPVAEVRLDAVEALVILGDETARDRVPDAIRALPWRMRRHPRVKRLAQVAASGEALTPWKHSWD